MHFIIFLAAAVFLVRVVNAWRRERAAEKDWETRVVRRPAAPVDMAAWTAYHARYAEAMEKIRAGQEMVEISEGKRYWEKIERNRRLNGWN